MTDGDRSILRIDAFTSGIGWWEARPEGPNCHTSCTASVIHTSNAKIPEHEQGPTKRRCNLSPNFYELRVIVTGYLGLVSDSHNCSDYLNFQKSSSWNRHNNQNIKKNCTQKAGRGMEVRTQALDIADISHVKLGIASH
jgi:hypothetical protein